ncbi:MAG: tRNA (adenosine(37)-N6)-threonylcarbamoyltransferase complex dimerization subunit type 1 TsaB [Deltaproteobacteria bacterium HGW-Deltaproteobacteria-17]|nr:MAG: tRNA (adenosine(37)-N6)-threonylcarbamoyltransferase complex dimerization subunit type 1 TsaB [Deltaproteobacteria bacterium HGW-Deltaproteobacteria-17]
MPRVVQRTPIRSPVRLAFVAHRGLITLAIESSNPAPAPDPSRGGENENPWHGGVALIEGEREEACAPLGVERLRAERAGNERTGAFDDDLMPAIDRLCARAGVEPAQLGRIAVSVGPGGFTGLRIACAVAKSIAEATGAKLVGVPAAAGLIRGVAPEARDRGMVLIALAWKREDLWRVAFAPPGAHGSRLSVIPEGALTRLDRFLAAGPRGSGVIAAVKGTGTGTASLSFVITRSLVTDSTASCRVPLASSVSPRGCRVRASFSTCRSSVTGTLRRMGQTAEHEASRCSASTTLQHFFTLCEKDPFMTPPTGQKLKPHTIAKEKRMMVLVTSVRSSSPSRIGADRLTSCSVTRPPYSVGVPSRYSTRMGSTCTPTGTNKGAY